MAVEDACERDMLVQIRWQGPKMAVPLSQLDAIDPDESTKEAIGDWHYWISQGYCLSLLSKTGSDTHGGNGNLVVEAPLGRYRQNVKRIARRPFVAARRKSSNALRCVISAWINPPESGNSGRAPDSDVQ